MILLLCNKVVVVSFVCSRTCCNCLCSWIVDDRHGSWPFIQMGCAFVHVFFWCTFVDTCMPVLLFFCAELDLSPGAYGYRISNPAGLLVVPIKASMEVWSFLMCSLVSNFLFCVSAENKDCFSFLHGHDFDASDRRKVIQYWQLS